MHSLALVQRSTYGSKQVSTVGAEYDASPANFTTPSSCRTLRLGRHPALPAKRTHSSAPLSSCRYQVPD